jgi:hypothetical protein
VFELWRLFAVSECLVFPPWILRVLPLLFYTSLCLIFSAFLRSRSAWFFPPWILRVLPLLFYSSLCLNFSAFLRSRSAWFFPPWILRMLPLLFYSSLCLNFGAFVRSRSDVFVPEYCHLGEVRTATIALPHGIHCCFGSELFID